MAHPYHSARDEHRGKAHDLIERTGHHLERRATGGRTHSDAKEDEAMIAKAIHEHESADHPGKKKTKLKFAAGGHVEGESARHHMGKRARGGQTGKKGGHVTNVIVAPQGGGAPGGMRPPMPAPGGQPMMAPPPRPAAPPPAAMPAGGPPGGMPAAPPPGMRPPGAMKRGGGVQRTAEVGVPSESLMQSNRGGKVRKREMGGSAGVPANPSSLTPQQLQRIAAIRREEAAAQAAQKQNAAQTQGPMGAAEAARMGNAPMQKRGGEVHVKEHTRRAAGGHVVPHIESAGGGGMSRVEKMRAYGGDNGFDPYSGENKGGFKLKDIPAHA